MPGFFDDIFGGGGDPLGLDFSSIGNITADPSTLDFLSTTQPFDLSSITNSLGGVDSIINNIGSTFGNFTLPGLPDLNSIDWNTVNTGLNLGGGGLDPLHTISSIYNNPLTKPLINQGITAITGGGGTTQPGSAGTTARPTATTAGGGTTISGGGGLGSILSGAAGGIGSLLSNPALLSTIPAIFQAISSKDQTDLGPDAANLRALATKNQDTINSLSAEAQAEKTGQLPGPALASLEDNVQRQKAAFATSYSRMGMSGSSAEAADVAALNRQAEQDRMQIGLNMANEGLSQVQSLTGQDVSIYNELMNAQTQRDNEYMQAMADLAGALGKAFGGTTVNVGGGAGGSTGGLTPAQLQQIQSIVPPGTLPAGATIQDIINQINGVTSHPINPVDLIGVTQPDQPLVADPNAPLPGPTVTPITPVNPDPNDFIPELGTYSGGDI